MTSRFLVSALIAAAFAKAAYAEPVLKVINFTADWCPNCQVLNPRIDEALSAFEAEEIERVDLDLTLAGRRAPMDQSVRAVAAAEALADQHGVSPLWKDYGGITGLAVIVAGDSSEPIACVMRPQSVEEISGRLRLSHRLVTHSKPGTRSLLYQDCPAPKRR